MNKILRNRWFKLFVILLLTTPLTVNSYDETHGFGTDYKYKSRKERNKIIAEKINHYVWFVQVIGMNESSNRYHVESGSSIKYYGKYQFSYRALTDIGMEQHWGEFLKSKEIQEASMYLYLKKNKEYLSDLISKYEGKRINGILITKAGILAGAHLVGNGGVRQYLSSNGAVIPKDGNGTSVQKYISLFQTTDLTLDDYIFNLSMDVILN